MRKKNILLVNLLFTFSMVNAQTATDIVTELNKPKGLLINGNDLYIADIKAGKISKIDITQTSPTPVDVVTGLKKPANLALHGNDMYITERGANKISKIDITETNPTLTDVITGLKKPAGLALRGNDLYIAEMKENKISKIDITLPSPVAIDVITGISEVNTLLFKDNDLYFTTNDGNNTYISKIDISEASPTQTLLTSFTLDYSSSGLAIRGNDLYMSGDTQIHKINISESPASLTEEITGLSTPRDLIIYGNDLYIAETGKISKFTFSPPLVINEILVAPDFNEGDANGDGIINTEQDEFIEIYNTSGDDWNISGWKLADSTQDRHVFPEGTIIPDNEAIVVFGGGISVAVPRLAQTASTGTLHLDNNGETITLKDATGGTILTETYLPISNQSIARNPDFTGNFIKHSAISTNRSSFSPGRDNTHNHILSPVKDYFITTWNTEANDPGNTQIILPIVTGVYDVDINNDGTFEHIDFEGTRTIDLNNAGIHTIAVRPGTSQLQIRFGNRNKAAKLTTIEEWSPIAWISMESAFSGCTNINISATAGTPNLNNVTNMSSMFANASSFNSDISNWNVSNVSDMTSMFQGASSFNSDISNWNVSNVSDMTSMFQGASNFSFEHYGALFSSWSQLNLQRDVIFEAPPVSYCSEQPGRGILINTYNWTITGDKLECPLSLSMKALLQGPYNEVTNLMNDDLRVADRIPLSSPYKDGINITNTDVFDNPDETNDIVDWVLVELRDATDITKVITSTSALIQRDGDIVATDGTSDLNIISKSNGNYYVGIKHRNHIPIATNVLVNLSAATTDLNLTNVSNVKGTTNAMYEVDSGIYALFAGDTDGNNQVQIEDYNLASTSIGRSGYFSSDADMNGEVQIADINLFIAKLIGSGIQF